MKARARFLPAATLKLRNDLCVFTRAAALTCGEASMYKQILLKVINIATVIRPFLRYSVLTV